MKTKPRRYYYVYRSSITGGFVTAEFAAANPSTTTRERRARW
jgi:hypothetical protein